jgi:hypothetical protein
MQQNIKLCFIELTADSDLFSICSRNPPFFLLFYLPLPLKFFRLLEALLVSASVEGSFVFLIINSRLSCLSLYSLTIFLLADNLAPAGYLSAMKEATSEARNEPKRIAELSHSGHEIEEKLEEGGPLTSF